MRSPLFMNECWAFSLQVCFNPTLCHLWEEKWSKVYGIWQGNIKFYITVNDSCNLPGEKKRKKNHQKEAIREIAKALGVKKLTIWCSSAKSSLKNRNSRFELAKNKHLKNLCSSGTTSSGQKTQRSSWTRTIWRREGAENVFTSSTGIFMGNVTDKRSRMVPKCFWWYYLLIIHRNPWELIGQRYTVQIDHEPKHRVKAAKDNDYISNQIQWNKVNLWIWFTGRSILPLRWLRPMSITHY